MPLVERFNDWNITDGSFNDPHTLEFDHRIEAATARNGAELANVEDNVKATCVITILKPEFGWTQADDDWIYDPTDKETDLSSIWRNRLPVCVQHDKESLKDTFCNATTNPDTAYVGPKANVVMDNIDALEWPTDATEFISRFPLAGQYMIGPIYCSAYHFGDGYVGTAGHCLDKALLDGQLGELRVVFNWIGDVVGKKVFTKSEVFEIERVISCDSHGPEPSPTYPVGTVRWSSRWDSAILKLVGTARQLSHLRSAKYASSPPKSGSHVYNIGCPLGTQLKVSINGQVLRHSLEGDDENPLPRRTTGCGTFTTDLDQFEGNSGGPVFDASTGHVGGHTSSTQDAVAEGDVLALESWASENGTHSKNYTLAAEINGLLEKQEPNNKLYRIHPKFLRTLSALPGGCPLIKCVTVVCPGDLGPNRVMHAVEGHQAVFSRHAFASKDVWLKNTTARADRNALFTTPLNVLISDYATCTLAVHFVGKKGIFRKPDASSALVVASNAADWHIQRLDFRKDNHLKTPPGTDVWSVTIDLAARRDEISPSFLNASRGLIEWTKLRLEQPLRNPPLTVGLRLSVKRPGFQFPVNKTYPLERTDGTRNRADADLEWPEETFEFVTTAGETSGIAQTGGCTEPVANGTDEAGIWIWEAPVDRVWTNPRQPSHGLRDALMDDFDESLA